MLFYFGGRIFSSLRGIAYQLDFPHSSCCEFDLDDMEDDERVAEFRVKKQDLDTLAEVLQIPASFKCHQRSKIDRMEGLYMLLGRFAYPSSYSDMVPRFGRPVPVLSMATNTVLDYIYDTHGHLLTDWDPDLLSAQAIEEHAQAVSRKGSRNCPSCLQTWETSESSIQWP